MDSLIQRAIMIGKCSNKDFEEFMTLTVDCEKYCYKAYPEKPFLASFMGLLITDICTRGFPVELPMISNTKTVINDFKECEPCSTSMTFEYIDDKVIIDMK